MTERNAQQNHNFDNYIKSSSSQELTRDLQAWDERRAIMFAFIGAGIGTAIAGLIIDKSGQSDLNEYGSLVITMSGVSAAAILGAVQIRLGATSHAISEELRG